MATADGGYEGGLTGGKFRKRPFRKAASATPYDRPPALDRALRNRNGGQGERNRWFSKIVDPASRLINYGASMFFSSVFRKRLAPAPPPTPAPAAGADVSSFIEETAQGLKFDSINVFLLFLVFSRVFKLASLGSRT